MTDASRGGQSSTAQARELLQKLLREKAQKSQRVTASSAQRRLWFIDRMEEPNPSYNIACHVTLRGALDATLLERSLNELARRHGTLRTTFEEVNSEPVQVVAPAITLKLPLVDLTPLPASERRAQVAQWIGTEAEGLFDLRNGPLIRGRLLRVAPREHVLVLVIHHIIGDGWSVGVLVTDLFRIYEDLRNGRGSTLARLPLQYIDYAARQARWLKSEEFREQLGYWAERLAGLPILDLPTDRPRPPVKGYKGATHSFTLDPGLSRGLKQLCEREGATLFMVMMTAFSILLHRYTGQEDVVFGTPIANRNRADIEGLIGFFVNTLIMRNDVSGNPGFRELLRRVSASVLADYRNQDAPFEHLVEELRPERNPSRNPLFQVAFALQNESLPSISLDGLEVSRPVVPGYDASEFDVTTTNTRVDLELHLWEGPEGLRGTWSFDVALFDAATIERMTRNFVRLLQGIVANPQAPIAELPLLDEAERRQLLVSWNETARPYERDAAVHELFESCVDRAPDAPALVFGRHELTYAQLNSSANRLARHLVAGGVEPGQLVGVCLERGIDLITALLAILKAGAVYVPLDPKYPEARLRYMLQDAALSLVLTQTSLAGALSDYAGRSIHVDAERADIDGRDAANLPRRATAESLAYVIYTSGSTGKPKGTLLEHRGLCKVSAEQVRLFGAGPGHRVLQFSSPNFDASLFEIVMALTTGATLVVARAEELQPGPPLLTLLREQRISILTIPPSSLGVMSPEPLPDLKVLNVAGEACPAELVARWAPGRRFFNLYGPTECTIWSTANECVADGSAPHIGRAIANTQLFVLDARGQPVPIGVPGELYIGGDGVARGYLNLSALTADKFVANPFVASHAARMYRTGDKVRYRADGALEFIGRIDHQVKIRGFRIEPGEIEAALRRQPGVANAAVIARQDQPGDAQLVAYVVMDSDRSAAFAGLRAALQQTLPAHMIPAVFVPLDTLPLTPNGKIDTRALPRPQGEHRAGAAYAPPLSQLEHAIAGIWKEVLGVDQVGVDDNFFDLGGHSLRLVKVHEQVNKLIDRELPIVTLFQYPTIRSLTAHLRHDGATAAAPASAMPSRPNAYGSESIAVIGMAGRFPGAPDLDRFWRNLREGVEAIRFFSQEELRAAGIDEESLRDPSYVPAKGYLENADLFDARFFGYSPREAELIDPQQRIFLEVAWEALEAAGYDSARSGSAIGVYAGSSENTYWYSLLRSTAPRAGASFEGTVAGGKDFLATRIAYKLDLHGPAVTVQTACSTSLVAVHEACKALLSGECGIALAGGVSVSVPLIAGYRYEAGSILSPDGHCRAFDEAAQGTLGGNGAGVVVLKRLSEALADGDTIHAVIRGSAINNDGSAKVGYTAPSVEGQSRAITAAWSASQLDPGTIGYVETHGTGTSLGDPIEIAALTQAFGGAAAGRRVAIGSVKTNVGHLDAAAGVAGLIKTVLALEHRELPPSLHFTKPNPKIDFRHGPFFVNERLRPWDAEAGTPRRAGVSSFGIGGTNAHVVLEEAPAQPARQPARAHQLLVLSARSKAALEQATANLAETLQREPSPDLADVAYTLQVGRKRFRHGRILVCRDAEGAVKALKAPASSGAITTDQETAERRVVFLFSGQGSQHVNMARDLYEAQPRSVFREVVDECCGKLRLHLNCDLRNLMYPDDPAATGEQLTQTRYAQPALFVIEYALARQWMAWGIRPVGMLGHSIGEYAAACLSGVMTLDDALALVAERGRLMYELPPGAMLSVPMAAGELQPLLGDELSIATINGPGMSVVSGTHAAIVALQARLSRDGIEAKTLHTSHAFHSPMMDPILDAFTRRVRQITLRAPQVPYVSNLTGDWITPEQATDPGYYAQHLRQAVRFSEGLQRLFARPEWVLLEVGPGQALCTLSKRHPDRPAPQTVVASLPRANERHVSDEAFVLESLGRLWLAGVEADWAAVHAPRQCRRVVLPTYPFEHERYWIEPGASPASDSAAEGKRTEISDWFYAPSWKRSVLPAARAKWQGQRWMLFVDDDGIGERIARELRAGGARVICIAAGDRYACTATDTYVIDPRRADDYRRLFTEIADSAEVPQRIVHLWGIKPESPRDDSGSLLPRCLDRGCHSLMYLAQALGNRNITEPLNLTVVTTQVHDVNGTETLCPEKATVLGPCRVIGTEYPFIRARNLDIESAGTAAECSSQALNALLAEADSDSSEVVVAYRGRYRWIQAVERLPLEKSPGKGMRLREGGAYLITGGLGGMGLELASWLARTVRARLVLVGRTALPPRNEWEHLLRTNAGEESVRARIERVLAMEALGAEVMISSADVADGRQMAAVVAAATARFGAIHGVIHAAGTPGGGVIQRQTPATLAPVLAPKVQGTRVLESLFRDTALDFMVLCSSMITLVSLPGRADYVSASAFIDAFAHHCARQDGSPVIAVNWDTWVDAGMAVEQRASAGMPRHTAEEGIRSEEGVEALQRILDAGRPQVIVSVREFDPRKLQHALSGATATDEAEASTTAVNLHPRPALANEFVAPRNDVEQTLAGIWRELLGIADIGVHDNFFELGGDSVISIQFTAKAKQKGIKLTPKQTFEHQTIAELAAVATALQSATEEQATEAGTAPLTPIQRWFFEQDMPDHYFNQAVILEVLGTLQESALRGAVKALVMHHGALRLRVSQPGSGAREFTVLAADDNAPVRRVDLSGLDAEAQRKRIEAAAVEAQRGMNVSDGPILRVDYFDPGPGQAGRLLIVIHHLAVDAVAWRILLEDLQTAYGQLAGGTRVALPARTTSLRHWSQRLAEYAQTGSAEAELEYWLALGRAKHAPLPVDAPAAENTVASADNIVRELDEEETSALLKEVPQAYKTQISDVLLTALAQAFARWTGQPELYVHLEGHGREALADDLDVSRTVGWFTTLYPVRLVLPVADDAADALVSVKEQLRTIPNHGRNFGVLRYLSGNVAVQEGLRAIPDPQVVFLYLGRFDQGLTGAGGLFAPAAESTGLERSEKGRRQHLLEITSMVTGNRLRIHWRYSTAVHRRATIEKIADGFLAALRDLIAHCRSTEAPRFTASDFPAARLNPELLNQLAASLNKAG